MRLVKGLAVALVLFSLSANVQAQNNGNSNGNSNRSDPTTAHAPEMDAASMGSALALLGCGTVMVFGRRRAQNRPA